MDFQDVIRKRRMVRNYTDDPVDQSSIERLIQAARRAPSAGFSQGQYLVVVTSAEMRRAIANLAGESDYVAAGFDPWISGAPVHFVLCTSESDYHRRYEEPDKVGADGREVDWPVPYWWVDAGASMMLLLLAAVDEGLAAGFLGIHSIPGLQALLGIPDEVIPIGVVTVGHAAPDRKGRSVQRGWRKQSAVVHREGWDGGNSATP